LDSRQKIVTAAHPGGGWAVVLGYFDPLLPAHASSLRELRSRHTGLLVIVEDPPHPVLPREARLQLLAALDCVDQVTTADGSIPVTHDERPAHQLLLADLIHRVERRHQPA
jgi:hypothetical protein